MKWIRSVVRCWAKLLFGSLDAEDNLDKIDYAGLLKVSTYLHSLITATADQEMAPDYVKVKKVIGLFFFHSPVISGITPGNRKYFLNSISLPYDQFFERKPGLHIV